MQFEALERNRMIPSGWDAKKKKITTTPRRTPVPSMTLGTGVRREKLH